MAETATNNGSTKTNTDGKSSVAFDFVLKKDSDCLPDKTLAEITRRLIGTVTSGQFGDVIFAKDPPNDTKKLWVEESNTGANVGTVKRYDSASGEWVDDHTALPGDIEINDFSDSRQISSDDETVVYAHNFGTNRYGYNIKWASAPLDTARWYEVNQDTNTLEIKFLGASGVTAKIDIIEIII